MTLSTDINRQAPVVVELSITIDAPLEAVWRLHTDIDKWPTWQANIVKATLTGPPAAGSWFEWETHGRFIVSTIAEVQEQRRIVWGGPTRGVEEVHVWMFAETPGGVIVHVAQSWDGPPVVDDDHEEVRCGLTASLTAWLTALKCVAEAGLVARPQVMSS